jgi:hypothetical protein
VNRGGSDSIAGKMYLLGLVAYESDFGVDTHILTPHTNVLVLERAPSK